MKHAISCIRLLGLLAIACLVGEPALADDHAAYSPASNPHLMGERYLQASAEVEALQRQAYNVATRRLDALLGTRQSDRPPAVVLDIDETVLNNTPYSAAAVRDGFRFPSHWQAWIDAAQAPLIPGAKGFLEHADARGVTIYYVSDRNAESLDATVANLARWHLPQATVKHVRLQGPSKKDRRDAIAADHDILVLVGDTLHDFDAEFAGDTLAPQRDAVARLADEFGDRFIVLPNSSYGDWEHAKLKAWTPPANNASSGAPQS